MLRTFIRQILIMALTFFAVAPAFGFGGGGGFTTTDAAAPVVTGEMKELTIKVRQAESNEILQVPLFSEKYAKLAVATVEGDPITLEDFALELATMHNSMTESETPSSQNFNKMLERLISIKLIKQEALNIGFDRTPSVQNQVEVFALKTMIQQLLAGQLADLQVSEEEVEELYQQMAIEVKLLTYRFFDQADAEALLEDYRAGGDFKDLADKMVAKIKAEGGEDPEYARLNDLFPAVAKAVYTMENGDVSEAFKAEKGYLLFRLEDRRVYEDQDIRLTAANRLIQKQSREKQLDYLKSLEDKYATFHADGEAALDFAKIAEADAEAKGTEIFSRLSTDQRSVVTLSNGQETVEITVAELAKKLESSMYHGMDRTIDHEQLDNQKELAIWNKLIAIAGKMEAQAQGIDKSEVYLEKVQEFEDRVLFDTFMAKAVVPSVTVPEDDVKKYYYNHLEDYSSPLMLKMKSLVFTDRENAQDALKKLQAGSDFKWVSANITGLADADDKDLLNLGGSLLSVNALPHDLQHKVTGAKQGDLFFYADPGNLYYTLLVDSAFPPKAKTYQEVRQEVGKIIYAQKINEALADWVAKLKEVYETEIFIVQDKL